MQAESERLVRRLESVKQTRSIVDGYYEEIRTSREAGKLVIWSTAESPIEFFVPAGAVCVTVGNWAARVSARRQHRLLFEVAEEAGFPKRMCSYNKMMIGFAILMARGEEERLPADYRLPKPDLIFTLHRCQIHMPALRAICDYLQVPGYVMDVPFVDDESRHDRYVSYCVEQLKDLISLMERLTGRPYDWEALRSRLALIKQESQLRFEVWQLCQAHPAPMTAGDWLIALGPSNVRKGTRESIDFWQKVKEEVEDRVKKGIGSVPDEKVRLLWHNVMPWHRVGQLGETMARSGVVLYPGEYAFHAYGDPSQIDLDRPLHSVVEGTMMMNTNRNLDHETDTVKRRAQPMEVDGVVFHAPLSCRPLAMGAYDITERVESEAGLPCVVVEADHVAPDDYDVTAMEGRMETLATRIRERGEKGQSK